MFSKISGRSRAVEAAGPMELAAGMAMVGVCCGTGMAAVQCLGTAHASHLVRPIQLAKILWTDKGGMAHKIIIFLL